MVRIPNFQKVSDDLYRSAEPTAQDLRELKIMGVRTVVNLRSFHSTAQETRKSGLNYEQIRVKGGFPKEKQVIKFLRLATNSGKTPVLVHSHHGRARTGIMCAVYRIAVQGWTQERALEEMIEGGFNFQGTRKGNAIQWINNLNIPKIKMKAGIKENDTAKLCEGKRLKVIVKSNFRLILHKMATFYFRLLGHHSVFHRR
jgi:tyrosine-protein phosphatase SIW14